MSNRVKDKPRWSEGIDSSATIDNLDALSKLVEICESYQKELGGVIEQAFLNCPDLKERYDELQLNLEVVTKKRCELIEVINKAVLESGESIKGEKLQAVFSKGRTSWDAKALEGYAIAQPDINELKKVGKPSVSIREVKDKS